MQATQVAIVAAIAAAAVATAATVVVVYAGNRTVMAFPVGLAPQASAFLTAAKLAIRAQACLYSLH